MVWDKKSPAIKSDYTALAQGVTDMEREVHTHARVPVFGDAAAEIQKELDKIVAGFSFSDPAAGKRFGLDAIRENDKESEKNVPDVDFSRLEEPMFKAATYINQSNIKELSERTGRILKEGKAVVQPGSLKRLFSCVAGIVSKEKASKMTEPDSIARLQSEMRHTLLNFDPYLRDIQIASLGFPEVKRKLEKSYTTDLNFLDRLSVLIAAGNEISKRYRDEILPEAEKNKKYDVISYDRTLNASRDFDYQMRLLSMIHLSAMNRAKMTGIQIQTVSTVIGLVETILTSESVYFKARLRTQHRMLENLDIMNLLGQMQDSINEKMGTLTQQAKKREESIDDPSQSPEQIEEIISFLHTTRNQLAEMAESLPAIEQMKVSLADQLARQAQETLNIQIQYANKALEIAKR